MSTTIQARCSETGRDGLRDRFRWWGRIGAQVGRDKAFACVLHSSLTLALESVAGCQKLLSVGVGCDLDPGRTDLEREE